MTEFSERVRMSFEFEKQQDAIASGKKETTEAEQAVQAQIDNQISRAANILRKKHRGRLYNGESMLYSTGWANIFFDFENGVATQGGLYGVYNVRRRFPLAEELSCVQLYLRPATLDGTVHSDKYDYATLFSAHDKSIYVPGDGEGYFPLDNNEVVLPGDDRWLEIDVTLGQLAIAEFSGQIY
jgi:hypothetical protein